MTKDNGKITPKCDNCPKWNSNVEDGADPCSAKTIFECPYIRE